MLCEPVMSQIALLHVKRLQITQITQNYFHIGIGWGVQTQSYDMVHAIQVQPNGVAV